MAQIIAGVFDDEQAATAAAHQLRDAGFDAANLDQFVLNPPGRHHGLPLGGDEDADAKAEGAEKGAVTGAAVGTAIGAVAGLAATPLVGPVAIAAGAATGAYAGSLTGAMNKLGDRDAQTREPRPAGVMVAVNVETAEDQEVAIDLLRDGNAQVIERAEGSWRDGKWVDFDPVSSPDIVEIREREGDDATYARGAVPGDAPARHWPERRS
jgi:hypothetical protein